SRTLPPGKGGTRRWYAWGVVCSGRVLLFGCGLLGAAGCWLVTSFDELRPEPGATGDSAAGDADAPPDGSRCGLDLLADAGPTPIVAGQDRPTAIAVDPAPCGRGAIFWTTDFNGPEAGVYMAAKDGRNAHLLAADPSNDVAASASHVAWASFRF